MQLRWEALPYKRNAGFFADVPEIGRYMIKRAGKGKRTFDLFLNGALTTYRQFKDPEDLKHLAQRIVNARQP